MFGHDFSLDEKTTCFFNVERVDHSDGERDAYSYEVTDFEVVVYIGMDETLVTKSVPKNQLEGYKKKALHSFLKSIGEAVA